MPEFKIERAFVLSARPLGERSFIITVFTRTHGRHAGVIKQKKPPEIGSFIDARWQARLSEHMGAFYIDQIRAFSVLFMDDKKRLAVLTSLCAILDKVLPERQEFQELYDHMTDFFPKLWAPEFLIHYIRFEAKLLETLGFGFDFRTCTLDGDANDLAYVSPKTGRAASREKGAPWRDKLLPLPRFLWQNETSTTPTDIQNGLNLTAYFLTTYAGLPSMPQAREQLYRD